VAGLGALCLLLSSCTVTDDRADQVRDPPVAASPASTAAPSPSSTPAATATPSAPPRRTADAAPHPVSLPALMRRDYDGRGLRLGPVLEANDAFTKHAVTYRGSGLTVSGVLYLPSGPGPFPALVLNHGYIDPVVYVTGQGLQIEQEYLARSGFVVLHTDYRNHAGSDRDPDNDVRLRLGYTEDTINAVLALRTSGLPQVDPERIGMLGRSMGGGVTLNALVVEPDLVKAAVVYASVSSNTVDNHRKWTRGERPELAARIERRYGSPEQNPRFWRNVSPRTFAERVRVPLLVHHGTADTTCPIAWADATVGALERAGADVTYLRYPGEGHAFSAAWADSMQATVEFFRRHL
jgi:dipeptidyl aminopeptidase/acylaminoacyl peptidase